MILGGSEVAPSSLQDHLHLWRGGTRSGVPVSGQLTADSFVL